MVAKFSRKIVPAMDGAKNRAVDEGEGDDKEVVDHPSSPEAQRRSNSTSATAREDISLDDAAVAVEGVEGADATRTDAGKRDRARRANHHADVVGVSANRNSYPYARFVWIPCYSSKLMGLWA